MAHRRLQYLYKRIRYESHYKFINQCYQHSIVPNGFKIKWSPDVEVVNTYRERYKNNINNNNIKTDASLKIMNITIDAIDESLANISKEIAEYQIPGINERGGPSDGQYVGTECGTK